MHINALISRIDGLYVGMLDEDELRYFNQLIKEGLARRNYDHAGGIMGLAKVMIFEEAKSGASA